MTIYRQLLLSAGGGISDQKRKSEQREGATVIIGLVELEWMY